MGLDLFSNKPPQHPIKVPGAWFIMWTYHPGYRVNMRNSLQSERPCCPQKSEVKPFPVPSLLNQRMHARDPVNTSQDALQQIPLWNNPSININMKEKNDNQKPSPIHTMTFKHINNIFGHIWLDFWSRVNRTIGEIHWMPTKTQSKRLVTWSICSTLTSNF